MPKTFNTAPEAEAWLRANPMRECEAKSRYNKTYYVRFNPKTNTFQDTIFDKWTNLGNLKRPPYTVIPEADRTMTINGKQYREGDKYYGDIKNLYGCDIRTFKYQTGYRIIHIPDELADKPQKEPKTLTLEEVTLAELGELHYINPISLEIYDVVGKFVRDIKAYDHFKAHVDNGGKLYATREDAELGKVRGWK